MSSTLPKYKIKAYHGTDPFCFVSYVHDDSEIVFDEIKGVRFNIPRLRQTSYTIPSRGLTFNLTFSVYSAWIILVIVGCIIPRKPRIDVAGVAQHIIQRGVDRAVCFCSDDDRQFFLTTLQLMAANNNCCVHAYVLMTNHVHLLVTGGQVGCISLMMQGLGRKYVQHFNRKYHRTGTLWEGRFKSNLVDSDHYLLRCYCYIELNPVRAKMVSQAEDYKWSSFHTNAHDQSDSVISPHAVFLQLGKDHRSRNEIYRELISDEISEQEITSIRDHVNQGKVLGSVKFQHQIAELLGRSVELKSIGRPKKKK